LYGSGGLYARISAATWPTFWRSTPLMTISVWVGVSALQEYAVVMFVRGYVASRDYWQALPSIQKDVKQALDKAGVLTAVTRQAAVSRTEPQSRRNSPSTDDLPD